MHVAMFVILLSIIPVLSVQHGFRVLPPEESSFLLPRDNRDSGIVYSGSHERLRVVMGRMLAGED